MWHLMPDGRYAVTVTVDGRKDTTKLVSVAREELETRNDSELFLEIAYLFQSNPYPTGNI